MRLAAGNLLVGVLLLVILAAGPACAVLLDFQWEVYAEREAQARTTAFQQVELVNATMGNFADATRDVLVALSSQGTIRRLEPACSQNLDWIRTRLPSYVLVAVFRIDGTLLCSSAARPLAAALVQPLAAPFLQVAGFTIGRYLDLPDLGTPMLTFAIPVQSERTAAPAGVLVAGLDLRRLDALLAGTPQRLGGTMVIRDRDATVLARAPDTVAGTVGQRSDGPDRALMGRATVRRAGSSGTRPGRQRVLGYVPVATEPVGLFVSAGFDVARPQQRDIERGGPARLPADRPGPGLLAASSPCCSVAAICGYRPRSC